MIRQFALIAADGTPGTLAGETPYVTPWQDPAPDAPPGFRFLPIDTVDAEPFDEARHWRAVPARYVVNGDRVLRIYDLIQKEAT
jgi:hypothetical protein